MTPWREAPLSAAAREQQLLWGSNPEHWARFAEPHTRPLFEAVLAATASPTPNCGSAICKNFLSLTIFSARSPE
jgi:hypothetical protein